jgi:hypothetical protein
MSKYLSMKFNCLILGALLLAGLAACAAPVQTAVAPTPTPVPPAQPVTVQFTASTETGQQPVYTITTEIPSLEGAPAAQASIFDADVAALIQSQETDFKKSVQENTAAAIVEGSSYFDQRIALVSVVGEIVSIRLVTEAYVASAAHPYHLFVSYTFDLSSSRALSLDGLFLPGSDYLQTIANYCKTQLVASQLATDIFAQGADPTPENYQVWNLTADGLLITFNEYQVAPYAAGPQTVIVPYTELKGLIDPQGPLATFAP